MTPEHIASPQVVRRRLSEDLNLRQFEASTHIDGPLLILAGAGSGKTRVIAYRTWHLLTHGVSPKNILLITFTNKATREMKERLNKLIGRETVKDISISTFHAFCMGVMRENIHHLGFPRRFSIYHTDEQRQVFYEVWKELNLKLEESEERKLREAVSLTKNRFVSWANHPRKSEFDRLVKDVYTYYQERMKLYGALDFDDLLYYTGVLLESHPTIARRYQERFHYLMIDEYQDTNHCQYRIARRLSEPLWNLCVVGDDDQSIYGWRGADYRNILDFERDFKGAKMIKLEQNYRSTGHILSSAHAVIRHNSDRKSKVLYSTQGEGKRVQTMEAKDPWDEARKIGKAILLKRLKERNLRFDRFAVLFRTNSQSKPFEEVFEQMQIPYQTSRKYNFYERTEIKDALAYLRVLHNREDDLNLFRVIQFPRRGIGLKTIRQFRERAALEKLSLFEALQQFPKSEMRPEVSDSVEELLTLVENYRESINGREMASKFREYLHCGGFFDEIPRRNKDPRKAEAATRNVHVLIDGMNAYARKCQEPTLVHYLSRLALFFSGEEQEKEDEYFSENAVCLFTIHAAKGLEFPCVYLVGMEEKYLPYIHEETQSLNLREERRLCYVAMTRAQRELTLTFCKQRSRGGKKRHCTPSRFLDEIPDASIIRLYGKHLLSGSQGISSPDQEEKEIASLSFDRIRKMFRK